MNPAVVRRFALVTTGGALLIPLACEKKVDAPLEVLLPPSIAEQAKWIEVGVLPERCPDTAQLAGGLPPTGTVARVAFAVNEPQVPPVGSLPAGTYGFAAVARGEDCRVLASTCEAVELGGDKVTLRLAEAAGPTGACAAGTVCRDARCVPSTDATDPAVGSDCSLELLGSGPLPNLFTTAEELVSPPSLVWGGDRFLLAYREYSVAFGTARLTVLPIDEGGGALEPQRRELEGRCLTGEESDATGFAWQGTSGLITLSRAPCGNQPPALELHEVGAGGSLGAVAAAPFPAATSLTLSPAKAVAPGPGGVYYVAAVRDGAAVLHTVRGLAVTGSVSFGGGTPVQASAVAASEQVRALLATGPGTPAAPAEDGGAGDGGDDGGAPAPGRTVDLQRLQLTQAQDDPGTLPAPVSFEAAWGTVVTQGARTVVVSEGSSLGRGLVVRLFDGGAPVGRPLGYSPPQPVPIAFADAALAGDHLFLFAQQPGQLTLVAYDNARTTPLLKREVSLGKVARLSGVSQVRDGLVTVAASESRVAVAWVTARRFVAGPSTAEGVSLQQARLGGYAVFACRGAGGAPLR